MNITPFDYLDAVFCNKALYEISFDRELADEYRLLLVKAASRSLIPDLTKMDLASVLPRGGPWTQAIGKSSYFGRVLRTEWHELLLIGAVSIMEHTSRGAYPKYKAYAFPIEHPPSNDLHALARLVAKNRFQEAYDWSSTITPGIWFIQDLSERAYSVIEAGVLLHAAKQYLSNPNHIFRSLVLAEEDLEDIRKTRWYWPWTLPGDSFVMLTSTTISKHFSSRTREWLDDRSRVRRTTAPLV